MKSHVLILKYFLGYTLKKIMVLLLLSSASSPLIAQIPDYFSESPTWNFYEQSLSNERTEKWYTHLKQQSIAKVVVLDSTAYFEIRDKKIVYEHMSWGSNRYYSQIVTNEDSVKFLVRQEGRSIIALLNDSSEKTIIDYDVSVGEDLGYNLDPINSSMKYAKVLSIDSFSFFGESRFRIKTVPHQRTDTLIFEEGIGAFYTNPVLVSYGLFDLDIDFQCLDRPDTTVLYGPAIFCDPYFRASSIKEEKPAVVKFIPIRNEIELNQNNWVGYSYHIYGVSGQLLQAGSITGNQIDFGHSQNGPQLIFLVIQSPQSRLVHSSSIFVWGN